MNVSGNSVLIVAWFVVGFIGQTYANGLQPRIVGTVAGLVIFGVSGLVVFAFGRWLDSRRGN